MNITEINSGLTINNPIKERMDIFLNNVHKNIPCRNGFVYVLCGSGGSGKSSLLLNLFKNHKFYRKKFDNIYYITPQSSFLSVEKHPFEKHKKLYHELTVDLLNSIYDELNEFKENSIVEGIPIENSCIIIDDMANALKDNDLTIFLNKIIIKARHLSCCFIFTLQSYYMFPLLLRKQITNASIFKPKNKTEMLNIYDELINLDKKNQQQFYDYIYDKPYNHLDIDTVDGKFYKNFNLLEITDKE